MISPNIITEVSKKDGISWTVVEKDYFLSLLLDSIANTPFLLENLIFKGGTAIRKVYFADYRYSENLDFTMREEIAGAEIRTALEDALDYLRTEYNATLRIKDFNSKRHFTDIKVQFVGLKGNKNTITIDMGPNEIIVEEPAEKRILNPYYEKEFSVKAYSLEEIAAEKLRSFLQRTRVRDYYDAWYLLTKAKVNKKRVSVIFLKKVEYKKITFRGKEQLLDENRLAQAEAYYQSQLGNQVARLPPFKKMVDELRGSINSLDLT